MIGRTFSTLCLERIEVLVLLIDGADLMMTCCGGHGGSECIGVRRVDFAQR